MISNMCLQQVPDEIERVMVGIEAYLSIRKRTYDIGVSIFEFDDESVKSRNEKVYFQWQISNFFLLRLIF